MSTITKNKKDLQYKQFGYCAYNIESNVIVPSVWEEICKDIYFELYDLKYIDFPSEENDHEEELIYHATSSGWRISKVEVTYSLIR